MPDFMSMRMSSPMAFNATAGAALATSAADLMTALRQYQKTGDLSTTWTGAASQSHTDRLAKLADAATRVIQAITRAQGITATNGAQLTALKTQNDAITASAMAGQYTVLPTGQVMPGPPHYAAATGPHGPALMKFFWSIANLFSGQINGTVAASTMTDAQAAATIAAVAAEFFADLMSDKDKHPTGGQMTLPGGLPDSGLPSTVPPAVSPIPPLAPWEPPPGGTQLAGVGDLGPGLGGIGPGGLGPGGLGGLGGPGLTGAGALGGLGPGGPGGGLGPGGLLAGGAGMVGTAGAAGQMGAGAGGAGAGGAGAAGAAGRAVAGSGMMPMMPMGAHGGASSEQRHSSETWLHEDGDAFDPGDDAAPGAVLS